MRLLFLGITSLLLFSSCGYFNRLYTHWTNDFTYKCSRSGVEIIQSDSGITTHLDRDGKPVKCD